MSTYTREQVEDLMPAIWDAGKVTKTESEQRPDGDMPRSKPNPAELGTDLTEAADMQRAWRMAGLSLAEQRTLFCLYALHEEGTRVADLVGCHRATVYDYRNSGLDKIVGFLNSTSTKRGAGKVVLMGRHQDAVRYQRAQGLDSRDVIVVWGANALRATYGITPSTVVYLGTWVELPVSERVRIYDEVQRWQQRNKKLKLVDNTH